MPFPYPEPWTHPAVRAVPSSRTALTAPAPEPAPTASRRYGRLVAMSDPIRVRRVYDEVEPGPAVRVLVDRVWPRGVRKDDLAFDEWAKDVAPSTGLRRWYAHDVGRFPEFRRRYRAELGTSDGRAALRALAERARDEPLTLLTATKDVEHSHAAVLAELLRETDRTT